MGVADRILAAACVTLAFSAGAGSYAFAGQSHQPSAPQEERAGERPAEAKAQPPEKTDPGARQAGERSDADRRRDAQANVAVDTRGPKEKMVAVTGCLEKGEVAGRFTLTRATEPVTLAELAGTAGTEAAEADVTLGDGTMSLVGDGSVDLSAHEGHTVQVTGLLLPQGRGTVVAETRGHQDNEVLNPAPTVPDLNVSSIKHVSPSCPPSRQEQ